MFDLVLEAMHTVAEMQGKAINSEVTSSSVLLDMGLDSLSYAILVVELESKLGFDPFQLEDIAIYPKTMGEFVALYEKHQ